MSYLVINNEKTYLHKMNRGMTIGMWSCQNSYLSVHVCTACTGPAVAPNTKWQSNWTSEFVRGTVIYYTCPNTSYLLSGDDRKSSYPLSGDGRNSSDILCRGYRNTSYWQTEGGHVPAEWHGAAKSSSTPVATTHGPSSVFHIAWVSIWNHS
jgi:hypothetical protein